MAVKTYTREQYLEWCKRRGVKNPLPEERRNPLTECGYPTRSIVIEETDEVDADQYYKARW